jgi:N-acetylglucosamine malate deacetylase 2
VPDSLETQWRWLETTPGDEVVIVVPHFDDETIGLSSKIRRCPRGLMVHVTDGAPEDPLQWQDFGSREAYSAVRRRELDAALDEAGHIGERMNLEVIDGTAAFHIVAIARELLELFIARHISAVFTLAYEGGHPDHDAVAFAVHLAVSQLNWPVRIIEAPLYRREDSDDAPEWPLVWQTFLPSPDAREFAPEITAEESDLKRRMCAAFKSQRVVFASVNFDIEPLRVAPVYDFSEPANSGRLSKYYTWAGIDADRWRALARETLAQRL